MLESVVQSLVSGFPALALQFVVALAMLAAGVALYVLMTPMREIQLIRANNAAAALATAGAMVAMAIPLAAVIVSSVNVVDVQSSALSRCSCNCSPILSPMACCANCLSGS